MQKIKRTVIDNVPIGYWLVTFTPIYGNRCNSGTHEDCDTHGCFDNGQEYVAEIDDVIEKVTASNYMVLPARVTDRDESWNADSLWEGDTHDLRPRLFKTKKEAKEHVKLVKDRFNNPQPWEVFVKYA